MNILIAYAYDFVSYLMAQPDIKKYGIKKIILFGSSARNDYDKKSDIDLFIDTRKDVLNSLFNIKSNFFNSERVNKWKRLNIKNEINLTIGNLEDKKWRNLRLSLHSDGLILFDKYMERKGNYNPFSLIRWYVTAKDINRRVNLARRLYGYKKDKKKYKGVLEELKADILGDGSVIITLENVQELIRIFKDLGIRYKRRDIFIKDLM